MFGELLELAALIEEEEGLERFVERLPTPVRRRMIEEFGWQRHEGQHPPPGEWRVWMLMAGRGFGKTRVGAEWVSERARETPGARIALVGASREEVEKVMVEGPSGLLRVARTGERPLWLPSRGLVRFASGAEGFVYSAEAAEALRGPEHHFAWCDELAKWGRADEAWDNLVLGLRKGERPRIVVTTTPRVRPVVRRVAGLEGCVVTRGRTVDNPHLAAEAVAAMVKVYGGTRLGRQELDGELIEDVAGSLWPRALIEACRCATGGEMKRVVVGVDPPASAEGASAGSGRGQRVRDRRVRARGGRASPRARGRERRGVAARGLGSGGGGGGGGLGRRPGGRGEE